MDNIVQRLMWPVDCSFVFTNMKHVCVLVCVKVYIRELICSHSDYTYNRL